VTLFFGRRVQIYLLTHSLTHTVIRRCVWTGTAHSGWRHWSVSTSSVSLCRRRRRTFWT